MKKNEEINEEVKEEKIEEQVVENKGDKCSCGSECKCKKSNGTLIIVFILLMFVCLIGGLIGGYMLRFDNKDRCTTKEEIKTNDKEDSNGNDESANKISSAYLDEIYYEFNKIDLKKDDYGYFISRTNDVFAFDYLGVMYGNVTDDFKILYTLDEMVFGTDINFGEIYDKYNIIEPTDFISFYIRIDDLKNIANKIFSSVEIANDFSNNKSFGNIESIKCENGVCLVSILGVGGTGPRSTYMNKIVNEEKSSDGTKVIVETFYIEVDLESDENAYLYYLKFDHNSERTYTISNSVSAGTPFNILNMNYEDLVKNLPGGKGITYEFTFDNDGKFVNSVKR